MPPGEPQGYFVVVPPQVEEDRFQFSRLLAIVAATWKWAVAFGLLGAVLAAAVSLQMPFIYRAQALIAPVQSNGGVGGALRNQFGGLAALAGVDLGAANTRKEESFATLSYLGFARDFIVTEAIMPQLFAERWDAKAKAWRADAKPPTLEDAVRVFTRKVRKVVEDRKTGMITVMVEFESPELAALWANRMIDLVNDRLRAEATQNANRSIEYLNGELAKTNVVDLRQAIYRLIESQVNNAMLANVQREYAFRFIDRAVPPDRRISPKRSLMVVFGAFAGGAIGFAIALVRRAFRAEKAGRAAA
jgi:LPS O-antigen subunit length determinant protein (WzzB/FepE family)